MRVHTTARIMNQLVANSHRVNNFFSLVKLLILLKIQPLERKKNEKRDEKGTRIGHITERKRRQNLAKCCSVYFQS